MEKHPPRLVEVSSVPSIYIDGIARVTVCGAIIKVLCFELRDINGERVRMPHLEVVRPLESLQAGGLLKMVRAALAGDVTAPVQ